ncbi:hypothetical protein ACVWYO_001069 [Sphingomonas sp. UYP23]
MSRRARSRFPQRCATLRVRACFGEAAATVGRLHRRHNPDLNLANGAEGNRPEPLTRRAGCLRVVLAREHHVRRELGGTGFYHAVAKSGEIQTVEHGLASSEQDR